MLQKGSGVAFGVGVPIELSQIDDEPARYCKEETYVDPERSHAHSCAERDGRPDRLLGLAAFILRGDVPAFCSRFATRANSSIEVHADPPIIIPSRLRT